MSVIGGMGDLTGAVVGSLVVGAWNFCDLQNISLLFMARSGAGSALYAGWHHIGYTKIYRILQKADYTCVIQQFETASGAKYNCKIFQ